MAGGDDRSVVLVIKGGIPKVHNPHIRVLQCSFISSLQTEQSHGTVTEECSFNVSMKSSRSDLVRKIPFHGYIPYCSLSLQKVYFQASNPCESACFCAKLKKKKKKTMF